MKTFIAFSIALLLAFQPQAANVVINVRDISGGQVANRNVTVTLTEPAGAAVAGSWSFTGDSLTLRTDTNGVVTFTNLLTVGKYRADIAGNPSRSFPFNISSTNGTYNLVNLLGTNAAVEMFYDTAQIDALLAGIELGGGGEIVAQGTNTLLTTNGSVVTVNGLTDTNVVKAVGIAAVKTNQNNFTGSNHFNADTKFDGSLYASGGSLVGGVLTFDDDGFVFNDGIATHAWSIQDGVGDFSQGVSQKAGTNWAAASDGMALTLSGDRLKFATLAGGSSGIVSNVFTTNAVGSGGVLNANVGTAAYSNAAAFLTPAQVGTAAYSNSISFQPANTALSNAANGLIDVINVKDLGANIADGSDDSLSASNAFWIGTNSNTGGTIFVPIGTLNTTNPFYLGTAPSLQGNYGNSKLRLWGLGRGASTIQFNGTNRNGLLINSGVVDARDIALIGNDGVGGIGFLSTNNGFPGGTLENLYFAHWDTGMQFDPIADGNLLNAEFQHVKTGVWLPGFCDVWDVSMRADDASMAALIIGGGGTTFPTIKRVHGGRYSVSTTASKYGVILGGQSYGNRIRANSETQLGPVISVGHPRLYYSGAQLEDYCGTAAFNDFYSIENGSGTAPSAITRAGTVATITLPSSLVSNLWVGQEVDVSGVTPAGFNGLGYTVSAIPSTTTVQYTLNADPGGNASVLGNVYFHWPYVEMSIRPEGLAFENGTPGNGVFVHSITNTADDAPMSFTMLDVRPYQATNHALFVPSTGLSGAIRPSANETVFNGQINGRWQFFHTKIGTNPLVDISSNGLYTATSTSSNFVGNANNLTNYQSANVIGLASDAVKAAGTYSWDTDANSYFSRVGAANISFGKKVLDNQLVLNGKAHGWWTNLEALYAFDGGTGTQGGKNLKQNAYNITFTGTTAFDTNGVTASNNDAQGDTGFLPSVNGGSSAIVKQNSMTLYAFNRTPNPTNSANDGCTFVGTFGNNNTKAYVKHNGNGSTTLLGQGPNDTTVDGGDTSLSTSSFYGHIAISRTNSSTVQLYFNNQVSSAASTSTALSDLDVTLFRRWPGGNNIYNGTIAVAAIGGGMTAEQFSVFKADIDTYLIGVSNLVATTGLLVKKNEPTDSDAITIYGATTISNTLNVTGTTTLGTANVTSMTVTQVVNSISLFSGPTNNYDMAGGLQHYVTFTPCAITGFLATGSSPAQQKNSQLVISNAASTNITFTSTLVTTPDGARTYTVTNGTVRRFGIGTSTNTASGMISYTNMNPVNTYY